MLAGRLHGAAVTRPPCSLQGFPPKLHAGP
jgi:hypothetical protein